MLLPSLHQCSVLRVFKATTRKGKKSKQGCEIRESNSGPLTPRPRTKRLCHPCSLPKVVIHPVYPHNKPGKHWLALWTYGDVCEIINSYEIGLERYQSKPLERWICCHWKTLVTNRQSLQAINSWTCGHYALMCLVRAVLCLRFWTCLVHMSRTIIALL